MEWNSHVKAIAESCKEVTVCKVKEFGGAQQMEAQREFFFYPLYLLQSVYKQRQ
jgi:hypothetical protein